MTKEDDDRQQGKAADFREHKIDMLAKAGEIGGIMKFILQNRDCEVPEDVVLKLRDKHPSPLRELSDQEKQGIIQVDITDSCRDLLGNTGTRLSGGGKWIRVFGDLWLRLIWYPAKKRDLLTCDLAWLWEFSMTCDLRLNVV